MSYGPGTPAEDIFGVNASSILAPDNANGPYFVSQEISKQSQILSISFTKNAHVLCQCGVASSHCVAEKFLDPRTLFEAFTSRGLSLDRLRTDPSCYNLVRSNVTEGTAGVPMHLELQFIDINTCEPADVLIDIWGCNTTGKYSGVSARGQGGLKTTWLRGVQKTDADGVVRFDTIFPGHYDFRATHEHIIAHVGSQVLPNGTYSGGKVAHLSQLFFDQDLRDMIEALPPYNQNRIRATTNLADGFTGYASSSAYDPLTNYAVLGSDVSTGLFAWHELGINTSSNWDTYASYASIWAEGGGRDNPNFNFSVVATPPPSSGGIRDVLE